MRSIDRGASPQCLGHLRRALLAVERETRAAPTPEMWDPGDCAQPIREALWRDQRGLCGYCMQRIEPRGHRDHPPPGNWGMRIEHLTPRDPRTGDPRCMYAWDNLLGVCGGRSPASDEAFDHCDRARGSTPLTVDPTRHPVERIFRYPRRGDGLVIEVRDDAPCDRAAVERDVEQTLCLNHPTLSRRRREALDGLRERLRRSKRIDQTLRRLWTRLAEAEPLPEFAAVLRLYVEGKMRQRALGA